MENKILVLYYHKIAQLEYDWNNLSVTPNEFYEQMSFLKENYDIIKLEEDFSSCKKNSVIITLDDGYEDNYLNALPILEELKIPATVFVSTENLDKNKEQWYDEIIRLLFHSTNYKESFLLDCPIYSYEFSTKSFCERIELYRSLRNIMLKLGWQDRKEIINDLRYWAADNEHARETHRILTTKQLIEMSKSPYISIGAHTITHPSLGALSESEQRLEIGESKDKLEKILNKKIELFSYPFGSRNDYSELTTYICEEMGFSKAVTTEHDIVDPCNYNVFEIPRVAVQCHSITTFQQLISSRFKKKIKPEIKKGIVFEYVGYFEKDYEVINGKSPVIILGAGYLGEVIYKKMKDYGIEHQVLFFCDNNTELHGCRKMGLEIRAVEEIVSHKEAKILIAISKIHSIINQIKELEIVHIHYYV